MSTTYKVQAGDTFELIARKRYGIDTESLRIASANPGVFEPLAVGTDIIIPVLPSAPVDKVPAGGSSNLSEGSLLIDGDRFRFWESVTITRSLDSVDTMSFSAPFDPNDPETRQKFKPFKFNNAEFTVNGDPLFKGTLVDVFPFIDPESSILDVSGYSIPGVLGDCTMPASSFPLEFNDQTLEDIARAMCAPFGIGVNFDGEVGAAFDKAACDPSRKVMAFLAGLAKQRNLVIGSTPGGVLEFRQSNPAGIPRARLVEGQPPLTSVEPEFRPQDYYSHITAVKSVFMGDAGSKYTVPNIRLLGTLRPQSFAVEDALGGDVTVSANAKMGRMFGNAAAYFATVATWRDPLGKLWEPNTTVSVTAPSAMVYNEYKFIVRSVTFNRSQDEETATLDLVLPGSFSGEIPRILPWD